jgi:hypothetical protein
MRERTETKELSETSERSGIIETSNIFMRGKSIHFKFLI